MGKIKIKEYISPYERALANAGVRRVGFNSISTSKKEKAKKYAKKAYEYGNKAWNVIEKAHKNVQKNQKKRRKSNRDSGFTIDLPDL